MKRLDAPLVLDEFIPLSLFDEIAMFFYDTTWKFGWKSTTTGGVIPHWHQHLAGGNIRSRAACDEELAVRPDLRPINQLWQLLRAELLASHSLVRCYANAHTFGLEGGIHRDNSPKENMITTVVYVNRTWHAAWGGETVFYEANCRDVHSCVLPKPRRVVVFDGSILHAARAPSRACRDLRITLVFKSLIL